MLQGDYIRVAELLHDLQLAILVALVLIDLLDCDCFTGLCPGGLKDYTE